MPLLKRQLRCLVFGCVLRKTVTTMLFSAAPSRRHYRVILHVDLGGQPFYKPTCGGICYYLVCC